MKLIALTATLALAAAALPALAQDISLDTRRMLSYGTTAVMVKVCGLPISDAENKQMMDGLAKYADRQKDLTPAQFTEAMQAAGAQIGSNKDAVCSSVKDKGITEMLVEAEAGE